MAIKILLGLWANNISAELAEGSIENQADNAYIKRDPFSHNWMVSLKSEDYVRLRTVNRDEETEIRIKDVIAQIRSELRERDRQEDRSSKISLLREASQQENSASRDRDVDIKILMSQNKGKKVNRKTIVEEGRSKDRIMSAYAN